jgi:hypothetical protein
MENEIYIRLLKEAKKDLEEGKEIDFDDFKDRLNKLPLKQNRAQLFKAIYGVDFHFLKNIKSPPLLKGSRKFLFAVSPASAL